MNHSSTNNLPTYGTLQMTHSAILGQRNKTMRAKGEWQATALPSTACFMRETLTPKQKGTAQEQHGHCLSAVWGLATQRLFSTEIFKVNTPNMGSQNPFPRRTLG